MASLFGLDLSKDTTGADPNFRLDVGSVLARTFSVWAGNLLPFTLVGLVVMSPVLIGLGAISISGVPMPTGEKLLSLLSGLLTLVLTGAVTYGVFQHLRGTHVGAMEVLRIGVSRLGPVWVTGFMGGLATVLGFCFLIVPGLVLMTRYWVAVPVAVIEEPGASSSLSRSTQLTEGNRWRVFALAMIMIVIEVAFELLLRVLIGLMSGSAVNELDTDKQSAGLNFLLELFGIPCAALVAVAPSIVYHDIRIGKEGADVEDLLKAFD